MSRILLLALAVTSPVSRELAPRRRTERRRRVRRGRAGGPRPHARGDAALKAERFREALTEFEAGYATVQRPGFLLNIAHAARRLGDLQKARANYKKFLLIEPTSKFRDDTIAIVAEIDSALADEDRAQSRAGGGARMTPATVAPAAAVAPAPLPAAPSSPLRASGLALLSATPADAPGPSDGEANGPVYRRTWFWVAAGVLLATGAGVGFLLAASGDGSVSGRGLARVPRPLSVVLGRSQNSVADRMATEPPALTALQVSVSVCCADVLRKVTSSGESKAPRPARPVVVYMASGADPSERLAVRRALTLLPPTYSRSVRTVVSALTVSEKPPPAASPRRDDGGRPSASRRTTRS
jgi:hypothetical protein